MLQPSEKRPAAGVSEEPRKLEEDIRHLAYQFYEERGREDGQDLDDWLRAEEELTKRRRTIAA